jgi:hypothetical protein
MDLRPRVRTALRGLLLVAVLVAATSAACSPKAVQAGRARPAFRTEAARQTAFLDTLEQRTFRWFWDLSDPRTGLTPDRAPTPSFASVAAVGFALTAYPIGAERGWVTRAQARERTHTTLRFLWQAPQGTAPQGCAGYRGFFYHFLEPGTGHRFEQVELSTMDTALLLAGALFCQSYFDRDEPQEAEVRALAESLYARVDWRWAQVRAPMVVHGWDPEKGFLPYDWRGMNESMLVPLMALGSPTHPLGPEVWSDWERGCRWGSFQGFEHVGFAPLFGHQFPQVWLDLRGLQDSLMRAHGIDWFENSRRATLAQRAYAVANPGGFKGYGERLWGLTACDGPLDDSVTVAGRRRGFSSYEAHGASFSEIVDDGTVSPSAAGGSVAFAPEVVLPALIAMRETYGDHLFGLYGFVDALNPTLDVPIRVQHGTVVPGLGWFDGDRLGIDQGPIVAMIENHRSGLVWKTLRKNPHIVRGLRAAGFTGGWLDEAPGKR